MRPIATNIADFETLRNAGQIYVDKTAHLHRAAVRRRTRGDRRTVRTPRRRAGRP